MSTQNLLDALKFAFFGSFEAKKGPFGFWTDVSMQNLKARRSACVKSTASAYRYSWT